MSRKQRLYTELRRRGGQVPDQAVWRQLGQYCGYHGHRDLAGFYGGRRPSMALMPDGSRRLTDDGWNRAGSGHM